MKKYGIGGLCIVLTLFLCSIQSLAAQNGGWALSDDGKKWRYMYTPNDWAEDIWIEENGKEYYIDSSGYMKTGWVTNKADDCKYYMGEDGAKCFNMFTPDDKYVGPDGVALESFDEYRKAIKKQLKKFMSSKEYKESAGQTPWGFLLTDINRDGYKDLAVISDLNASDRLVLAAIWDTEDEELKSVAEFDSDLKGSSSSIVYNPDTMNVWLKIIESNETDRDYFTVEEEGLRFENRWHFTMEPDDWGSLEFYVNGDMVEQEEWRAFVREAESESIGEPLRGYLPLTEETVIQTIDRAPAEEEMSLWL